MIHINTTNNLHIDEEFINTKGRSNPEMTTKVIKGLVLGEGATITLDPSLDPFEVMGFFYSLAMSLERLTTPKILVGNEALDYIKKLFKLKED